MTLIKIKRESVFGRSVVTQIRIKNHANFGGRDGDIVCAAVSSSTELVMNVLTENFGCRCEIKISEEPPEILLKIPKSEYQVSGADFAVPNSRFFAVCGLLDGFIVHLRNIARDYPENVRVTAAVP